MLVVNLPFSGDSKIPGAELGFQFFIKESYLEKDYFIDPDTFINMQNYDNKIIQDQVKKIVTEEIEEQRSILFFGGTHSTTSFIFENILENTKIPLTVFDAHIDKGDDISRYYNWNILSKINPLISRGLVIGTRHYYDQIANPSKFTIIDDIECQDFQKIEELIEEFIGKNAPIYVSIDLDVINSFEFPGVGFPEPGGISLVSLIGYIRKIKKISSCIIWDIVEFNPLIEKNRSVRALQRILQEIIY
ncbi:arginase family protein [Streptococcus suis]|uniref:arginase family protein n=1 Tax=Streptococcus suis TaxID=1307 RepID=UPI0037D7BCB8